MERVTLEALAHYLIDRGHEVTIVDNLLNGFRRNIPKKATFLKLIFQIPKVK